MMSGDSGVNLDFHSWKAGLACATICASCFSSSSMGIWCFARLASCFDVGRKDAGWRGDFLVDVEAVFVDRIEEGVELVVVTS